VPEEADLLNAALRETNTLGTLTLFKAICGFNESARDEFAAALQSNESVHTLSLARNDLGAAGLKDWIAVLKLSTSLRSLDLWGNNIGCDGVALVSDWVKMNPALESLDLHSNAIGPDGTELLVNAMATNTCLTSLNIADNDISARPAGHNFQLSRLLDANTNSSLTSLNISNNNLGHEGGRQVAEALMTNVVLKCLDISENKLGPDGCQAIAGALASNSVLETLNISRNDIRCNGAEYLAKALTVNVTLKSLKCVANGLAQVGIKQLAEALKMNTSLISLDLRAGHVCVQGAMHLADALKHNNTLKNLDIGPNGIFDEGAIHLAEALKVNTGLTSLKMVRTFIGDVGCIALADALLENSTLTTLVVSDCEFGTGVGKAAKALARALRQNHTLQSLDIVDNYLGPTAMLELLSALKVNKGLRHLYINAKDIDDRANALLREVASANVLLTVTVRGTMTASRRENMLTPEALRKLCNVAVARGVKVPWGRCKLMLVGEGRAGKTQTVRALQGLSFQDGDEASRSTALGDIRHINAAGDRFDVLADQAQVGDQLARGIVVQVELDLDEHAQQDTPPESVSGTLFSFGRAALARAINTVAPLPSPSPVQQQQRHAHAQARVTNMVTGDVMRNLDDRLVLETDGAKAMGEAPLSFTVWDCGGQAVFSTVHHLFLSSCGVYVLVFDMVQLLAGGAARLAQLDALRFWLNSVRLHADTAPLVAVGTHADVVSDPADWQTINGLLAPLRALFGGDSQWLLNDHPVKGDNLLFFPVDNTRGGGGNGGKRSGGSDLRALRNALVNRGRSLAFVDRQVPLAWTLLLDKLVQTHDAPTLTLSEFHQLGGEHGLDTADLDAMLEFCHGLGVLLHWRDTPALCELVTVKPQWLVDAIARVIHQSEWHDHESDKATRQVAGVEPDYRRMMREGVATVSLLRCLWRGFGSSDLSFWWT
jgi:Ran GTPase-activating protein (RanGAP) involved in mRNA processing and transport/GTPase SAR1 family protein